MRRSTVGTLTVLALLVSGACGRALHRDEAQQVLQRSPLLRPADDVLVEAISTTSAAEAIVRARIADKTTNLKFRRFDSGWAWEFVETNSGGWIAPEVAIAQIREEQRTVAAAKWAEQNGASYAATARTMYYVTLYHVPNPSQLSNLALWNKLTAGLVEMVKRRPEMQDRLPVLTSDRWTDAWGSVIAADFNSRDGSTLLVSFGLDRTRGTDDDVMCLNTFRRVYEDGRQVWQHERAWRLPENLGAAIQSFVDRQSDRIDYSQVIEP